MQHKALYAACLRNEWSFKMLRQQSSWALVTDFSEMSLLAALHVFIVPNTSKKKKRHSRTWQQWAGAMCDMQVEHEHKSQCSEGLRLKRNEKWMIIIQETRHNAMKLYEKYYCWQMNGCEHELKRVSYCFRSFFLSAVLFFDVFFILFFFSDLPQCILSSCLKVPANAKILRSLAAPVLWVLTAQSAICSDSKADHVT